MDLREKVLNALSALAGSCPVSFFVDQVRREVLAGCGGSYPTGDINAELVRLQCGLHNDMWVGEVHGRKVGVVVCKLDKLDASCVQCSTSMAAMVRKSESESTRLYGHRLACVTLCSDVCLRRWRSRKLLTGYQIVPNIPYQCSTVLGGALEKGDIVLGWVRLDWVLGGS